MRDIHDLLLQQATILIVDDQIPNVLLLEAMLRQEGYGNVHTTTDSREVEALFDRLSPDLLLLDLHMPHLDGVAVMRQIAPKTGEQNFVPVLVLTGDGTREAKQEALAAGAKDFLTKPFDRMEVLLRIRNLLEMRFLYLRLENQNQRLEHQVRERTRELEDAQLEILERLALAAEYRDDTTGQHAQRVGEVSALIAADLDLPAEEVDLIRRAALLHDIGKIGIPDQILLKPGRYTADEYERMKAHTAIGANIVSHSRSRLLQLAEVIARTHHEHWDGSGSAPSLRGEGIPLAGRIVAVADVFDALVHARPYKGPWPIEDAVAEIRRQSGQQFDPRVVEAFLRVLARDVIPDLEAPHPQDLMCVAAG